MAPVQLAEGRPAVASCVMAGGLCLAANGPRHAIIEIESTARHAFCGRQVTRRVHAAATGARADPAGKCPGRMVSFASRQALSMKMAFPSSGRIVGHSDRGAVPRIRNDKSACDRGCAIRGSVAIKDQDAQLWVVHKFNKPDGLAPQYALCIIGRVCPASQPDYFRRRPH